MITEIAQYLEFLDNSLWSFLALPGIMLLGAYFSYRSKFVQIRYFPSIIKTFFSYLIHKHHDNDGGIHPLKVFFASIGGCIGIGNIVAICTAVQIGGPGSLLWIWVTAILGSIIKYSEIYLGIRYRISNGKGGYHGGPMYFLSRAFKSNTVPKIVALLLCVYGVEIYQFGVIANTVTTNFAVDRTWVVLGLLVLVIGVSSGGIQRVGHLSSFMIPVFILCYLSMGAWVLYSNFETLPGILSTIIQSAFTGHAAAGAFAGSGLMLAISQGIRRGCYSGDVGVGYASVIHSESRENHPEKQAALAIFDIFIDTFMVCTTSILIVLVTGVWQEQMDASLLIQTALGQHFPFMEIFMPVFLFLLGYTTITAYFCAGIKCAEFLAPNYGKTLYYIYAALALAVFSYIDNYNALIVMSLTGGLLLLFNLSGIYRLRNEISFAIPKHE